MFVILVCVLLCKGSAFMLVGQELRWFLLVLLRLNTVSAGVWYGFRAVFGSLAYKKRHDRVLLHACGR